MLFSWCKPQPLQTNPIPAKNLLQPNLETKVTFCRRLELFLWKRLRRWRNPLYKMDSFVVHKRATHDTSYHFTCSSLTTAKLSRIRIACWDWRAERWGPNREASRPSPIQRSGRWRWPSITAAQRACAPDPIWWSGIPNHRCHLVHTPRGLNHQKSSESKTSTLTFSCIFFNFACLCAPKLQPELPADKAQSLMTMIPYDTY